MMIANVVMTNSRSYEITGDQFCSLMYKLIKCMLPVCSGFSPDNRPRLIVYRSSIPVNIFSITFHISLLEVCCESVHVLVVGQNGLRLCFIKVVVPDS